MVGKSAVAECLECCYSPYSKAKLVVPAQIAFQSSDMQEFGKNRYQRFGDRLEVQVVQKSKDPHARLLMKGDQNMSLRVSRWTADSLEDYLSQYFPRVDL